MINTQLIFKVVGAVLLATAVSLIVLALLAMANDAPFIFASVSWNG
jgi:hypothetical protein